MDIEECSARLWMPFTNMAEYYEDPVVIARSNGPWLFDSRGGSYIDCISSLWHVGVGHQHPFYLDALRAQIESGLSTCTLFGVAHDAALRYASELIRFIGVPNLNAVFLSSSGSEAVESALKIAIRYLREVSPRRQVILFLDRAYHGTTLGALNAMGIDDDRADYEPYLSPLFRRIKPAFDIDAYRQVIRAHADEIGALIIEPIQGAGGIQVPPEGFLADVAELCRSRGILLIADEVVTGFWRTGRKFAFFEELGIPDILVLSKGISAGLLPLGATVTTDRIFNLFLDRRIKLMHGNTYSGNPLSCAAGCAHLEFIQQRAFLEHLPVLQDGFERQLRSLQELPAVAAVRRKGFMAGVELAATTRRHGAPATNSLAALGRRHGLNLRPIGNIITLLPALTMTTAILEELFNRLRALIDDYASGVPGER